MSGKYERNRSTRKLDRNYQREFNRLLYKEEECKGSKASSKMVNSRRPSSNNDPYECRCRCSLSTALLHVIRPHAAIVFAPADSEPSDGGTIAVDMMNGPRAIKGLQHGSAFGLIVDTLRDIDRGAHNSLKQWAKQLNLTDSAKKCNDRVVLADMVRAWSFAGLSDSQIVERAEELIQGKIRARTASQESAERAKEIEIRNNIAIIKPNQNTSVKHLWRRGALVAVRESKIGMAINLSPRGQRLGLHLGELKELIPNHWFIHPEGFLACHGSSKCPKNPRDSGISLDDLATVVSTWIKSHENPDNFTDAQIAKACVSN